MDFSKKWLLFEFFIKTVFVRHSSNRSTMKFNLFIVSLFVLLVVGISAVCSWRRNGNPDDRILLSDVKVLTLEKGKMTTSRRSAPIPQVDLVQTASAILSEDSFPQFSNLTKRIVFFSFNVLEGPHIIIQNIFLLLCNVTMLELMIVEVTIRFNAYLSL